MFTSPKRVNTTDLEYPAVVNHPQLKTGDVEKVCSGLAGKLIVSDCFLSQNVQRVASRRSGSERPEIVLEALVNVESIIQQVSPFAGVVKEAYGGS